MRRFAFYLLIALLAFGTSSFVVSRFYWRSENISTNIDVGKNLQMRQIEESPSIQIKQERLTCNDESLQPFWSELKRHESFKDLDALYYWYDNGSIKSHDCSEFFRVNEAKDLNDDGTKEYFVQGINHGFCEMTADCDFYVFQLQDGHYKQILFDDRRSIEQKVQESISKGYLNIETETNDRLGESAISIYKFNGKRYKLAQCFTKTLRVFKNGDMKKFDPPLITRQKCL